MRITTLIASGLLCLAGATAAAEACGTGDEIFSVQVLGIFPNEIWHEDAVGVCFKNDSGRRLNLRYTRSDGTYAYTAEMLAGQTTQKLVDMGTNVRVEAVTNVRWVSQGQNCTQVWVWTFYPIYGYWSTRCESSTQVQTSDLISGIGYATLYDGPVILGY